METSGGYLTFQQLRLHKDQGFTANLKGIFLELPYSNPEGRNNVLTLFQGQFPWHEKRLRKGWPSGLCPNGLSCIYRATSGPVGGYGAMELPGSTKTETLAYPAGTTGLSRQQVLVLMFTYYHNKSTC